MSWRDIPGHSNFLCLYEREAILADDGFIFVEVGVALGHSIAFLARQVLDAGKVGRIHAVDPWAGVARNGEQQTANSPDDYQLYLDMMKQHASEELGRISDCRMTSVGASGLFQNHSVDMVLIDGAHDYDSVKQDILAWWPKVKPGGILAGDDHEAAYPGVEKACKELFGTDYIAKNRYWEKRIK